MACCMGGELAFDGFGYGVTSIGSTIYIVLDTGAFYEREMYAPRPRS